MRSSTSARPEDYRAGRQEEVYEAIFARIAALLPEGGRLYLQTMVFGANMIGAREAIGTLDALPERDTDAWYIALMGRQFPAPGFPSARSR